MSAATTDDRQRPSDGPALETGDEAPEGPIPDDEVYHLLQTRRRRLVLRYLRDREGPHTMRDVAEQVAAWEHDTTLQELRSEERQRVYIALYQTHLPRLDDAGVIEYNQSRGIVEVTDRIEQLYEVLDVKAETDGPVPTREGRPNRGAMTYFGGASLASTGLVTAAWAGLIALPGLLLATVVTGLFALLTVGVGVGE